MVAVNNLNIRGNGRLVSLEEKIVQIVLKKVAEVAKERNLYQLAF